VKDRAGMIAYVKSYNGDGIGKHYQWDSTGELAATNTWVYQVK
jgi:branched-chain amino acid transport system substrate-binding protein